MRERCLEQMLQRDLPGYAIGGLAGGEDKESFWRVVAHVSDFDTVVVVVIIVIIDRCVNDVVAIASVLVF